MILYKYSKLHFFIQFVSVVLFVAGLLVFEIATSGVKFSATVCGLIIFLVISSPYLISVGKRKIIINDSSINFYSFFNSLYSSKAERDFKVNFSEILKIDFKKTFLSKKISLKIKARNRNNFIFIEPFMNNHIELYSEICNRALKDNPDVYISPTVLRYCGQQKTGQKTGDGSLY